MARFRLLLVHFGAHGNQFCPRIIAHFLAYMYLLKGLYGASLFLMRSYRQGHTFTRIKIVLQPWLRARIAEIGCNLLLMLAANESYGTIHGNCASKCAIRYDTEANDGTFNRLRCYGDFLCTFYLFLCSRLSDLGGAHSTNSNCCIHSIGRGAERCDICCNSFGGAAEHFLRPPA